MVLSITLLFLCFGMNEYSSLVAGRNLMRTGNKKLRNKFPFLHVSFLPPCKVKWLKKATDGIDILYKNKIGALFPQGFIIIKSPAKISKNNRYLSKCNITDAFLCSCCGFCHSPLDTCTASDMCFARCWSAMLSNNCSTFSARFFRLFFFSVLDRFVVLGRK